MRIGQLKSQREAMGLTRRKMAEKLGVTERQIANWESGESIPHGFRRAQVAEAYGLKSDAFGTKRRNAVAA
jgi:transcriptional regulator with XRE-family HTH domain